MLLVGDARGQFGEYGGYRVNTDKDRAVDK